MDEIFVIETEHETEGYNGSHYDWYIDPDFGFFTTRFDAELRLKALQDSERATWDRKQAALVAEVQAHNERRLRDIEARKVLVASKIDPAIIPIPAERPIPETKPWNPEWSDYQIGTLKRSA